MYFGNKERLINASLITTWDLVPYISASFPFSKSEIHRCITIIWIRTLGSNVMVAITLCVELRIRAVVYRGPQSLLFSGRCF